MRRGRSGAGLASAGLASAALALGAGVATAAFAEPRLQVRPGLQLEGAQFLQAQSWFGQSERNLGRPSGDWAEAVVTPALDWSYQLPAGSAAYGRLSAIGASSNGVDASGGNVDNPRTASFELEDAYVGWRSGDLAADTLGKDAIDVSVGQRKYQIGSGFLFWKESSNGASRGATGIAPRKAARLAVTTKVATHGWALDAVYLRFNDRPSTDTRLTGADLSYTSPAWGVAGIGAYKVLGSDKATRAGMTMLNARMDVHPLPWLRGLRLAAEYVHQQNGDLLSSDAGFAGAGYSFAGLPWAPYVGYRRAIFRGDDPKTARSEAYDPMAIGISNWGSLVVSKYVQGNTNLRAHTLRLLLKPQRRLDLAVELYSFRLDRPATPGGPLDFADEADLSAQWRATDRLTLSLNGALVRPGAAAVARTGGDRTWSYLMLDASWRY